MPSDARYLVGQKLSNYQIEKIIRSYAEGVLASEAASSASGPLAGRSPNTVQRIYALLRERLFEIGFFPHPANLVEALKDEEYARGFAWSKTAERLSGMGNRLQGVTEKALPAHLAEALFRAENPHLTPERFFRDIRTAIKLTGPLNRPPRNREAWSELEYILTIQRQIDQLRRSRSPIPGGHELLIQGSQRLIQAALRRLRNARRQADETHV